MKKITMLLIVVAAVTMSASLALAASGDKNWFASGYCYQHANCTGAILGDGETTINNCRAVGANAFLSKEDGVCYGPDWVAKAAGGGVRLRHQSTRPAQ